MSERTSLPTPRETVKAFIFAVRDRVSIAKAKELIAEYGGPGVTTLTDIIEADETRFYEWADARFEPFVLACAQAITDDARRKVAAQMEEARKSRKTPFSAWQW